jgi:hypothetical protein
VISVEEWGKIDGEETEGDVSILYNFGRRKITPILHSRRESKSFPALTESENGGGKINK